MATASSTATLVVNPAFLQEIKDSNPDLYQSIEQLREFCRSDDEPGKRCRRLTRLLDSLRDQLALQFSLEESYGYLSVPHHPSRTLGELAAQTQSEHGMLYMQLSELAEQAEELQYRGVELKQLHRLIDRSCDFYDQLQQHEQSEHELIRRACDLS